MALFPLLALVLACTCRGASLKIAQSQPQPVLTTRTECTDPLCALSGSCNRFGCDACRPPGYHLDAQGTCRLAASLGCNDPRCLFCSTGDSGRCLQCLDGYGLDENHACRKCVDPLCAVCGPPAKCLHCQATAYDDYTEYPVYRDSAGRCKLCRAQSMDGTNCAACDRGGRCSFCLSGYFLKDGSCRPCSDRLCDACPGNKCTRCKARARASDIVNTKVPHSHYHPYGAVYMDGGGVCRLHRGEDDRCYLVDSRNRCRRCTAGYFVKDGVCKQCKGRDYDGGNMNCLDCSSSGHCSTCADGYGVNTTDPLRACVECAVPFCARCAADHRTCTECTHCVYSQDPPMGSSRAECVDMQEAPRLYFSAGRCQKCAMPNCRDCFKSGTCKLCRSGFKKVNGRCLPCKDESRCLRCDLPFCTACDGSGTACTACELGQGRDARCARCADPLCLMCADRSRCTACLESTPAGNSVYLSSSGRCTECKLPGCRTCAPNGRCLECGAGYATQPVAGACLECSDPLCAWCHWQGSAAAGAPQACDICAVPPNATSTYVNSRGVCAVCSAPGCLACLAGTDGACANCMEGWAEVGGACVACPEHCIYCQKDPGKPSPTCLECGEGFSLDSAFNNCVPSAS